MSTENRSLLRPAITLLLSFSLVTGILYPLMVTAIAQALFPEQASGSLVVRDGRVVGSRLIGQPFSDPRYFWSRPSATAAHPYDGSASTGSNLGPANPALEDAVRARVDAVHEADPSAPAAVPVDLVTASGSGLDPHISVAAARYQVPRVARLRRLPAPRVLALVDAHAEGRLVSVLGEPRVNVLALNLALDELAPRRR